MIRGIVEQLIEDWISSDGANVEALADKIVDEILEIYGPPF